MLDFIKEGLIGLWWMGVLALLGFFLALAIYWYSGINVYELLGE